jgi:2-keto-4-pentenoate hydratase
MDLIGQAAEFLTSARRSGRRGGRMPEAMRPRDLAEALAVQVRVTELLGEEVGGWKVSAPKPDKVMMAPIYARDIVRGPRCAIVPVNGAAAIEPEIAFVMARDVQQGGDVVGAIAETRLVLELIGSRFENPDELTFAEKLADRLNQQGLLVGPVVAGGAGDWASGFPIRIAGVWEGAGKHPDGHPLAPLKWLSGQVALKAGQIVTTGSYAGVIAAPLAKAVRVEFGDVGAIEVEFAEIS